MMARSQIAGAVVAVALVAVIGTALVLMGSPDAERRRRLDERRVQELQGLSAAVDVFWTRNGALPESLDRLVQVQGGGLATVDPVTRMAYEYRVRDGARFELCATFDSGSAADAEPGRAPGFWSHLTGRQCFSREAKRID